MREDLKNFDYKIEIFEYCKMGDDEVIDILERMKKQAEEISLRKVKQSENKHEKKHKKDKEILECFSKLERLNT